MSKHLSLSSCHKRVS